jgi:hypothetical protein
MTRQLPNAGDQGAEAAVRRASATAAARRARRIGGLPGAVPSAVAAPTPSRPDEIAPAAAERSGPPSRLNWVPAVVVSVGALTIAVLLIFSSHGVWWGRDAGAVPSSRTAALRQQVLAAAKTCVAVTNTYKYTDLGSYEKDALACSTGQFTSQLRDTIDRLIKVNAPRLKSAQTAQINRGGVEAISPDGRQWTILLFGQLSVTNTNEKRPRTDPFGAQVIMQRVGAKWLMAKLSTVSTPLG